MQLLGAPFRCFDCVRLAFGTLCLVFIALAIVNACYSPTRDVGGDGSETSCMDQADGRGIPMKQGTAYRVAHGNEEFENGSKLLCLVSWRLRWHGVTLVPGCRVVIVPCIPLSVPSS